MTVRLACPVTDLLATNQLRACTRRMLQMRDLKVGISPTAMLGVQPCLAPRELAEAQARQTGCRNTSMRALSRLQARQSQMRPRKVERKDRRLGRSLIVLTIACKFRLTRVVASEHVVQFSPILPSNVEDALTSEKSAVFAEDILFWTKWYSHRDWYKNGSFGHVAIDRENLFFHCNKLFLFFPEFRSLFDYRMASINRSFMRVAADQYPRTPSLHIGCPNIGPRFFIQHGFSTIIYAAEIGTDFLINQNVTIGAKSDGGIPRIRDRVQIRTGAVVLGGIEIGSDCSITANAVVSTSMPSNTIAYAPRTLFRPRSAGPASSSGTNALS